ncbi:unnamed protein product, partial [Choristocarpus tenellus]
FEDHLSEACESVSALRSSEILAREAFLRDHLVNLPPIFLQV